MRIKLDAKSTLRGAGALVALATVIVLAKCTSRRPTEDIASTTQAVKVTGILNDNANQFFPNSGVESHSAIFPPGTPGCPAGRAFVSHSNAWIEHIDLDELKTGCLGHGTCTTLKPLPVDQLVVEPPPAGITHAGWSND